jgi:hypothetical protein
MKAPIVGDGPPTLLTSCPGNGGVGIAVSAGRAFYTCAVGEFSGAGLASVPVDGSTPTELVPPPADGTSVAAIAVDCTNVYYATTGGVVARVPVVGGPSTTLASAQTHGPVLAVDADRLYFTDEFDFGVRIQAVPIAGGPVTTLAVDPAYTVYGIAVDSNYVYWTNGDAVVRLVK